MGVIAGAKRSIAILYTKTRFGHHGFSAMAANTRPFPSIFDDVQSIALFLRGFSSSSADQMSLIKQLRQKTSAPLKDVKSALVDCHWDLEAAQKELRRRGVYLASKKSSRTTSEGLLSMAQNDTRTAVIELNCETDFVARNEIFQYMALSLAKLAVSSEGSLQDASLTPEYLEGLKMNLAHPKINGEKSVQEAVSELAAMMGENVRLRRSFAMSRTSRGAIATYLHSSPQPGLGRIAGLLSLKVEDPNADLAVVQRVGSEIAMHVVASKPLFLTKELVSSDVLQSEREILKAQAEASGKPKMAIEKMVEGRLRKYYEEVVLMEQRYVLDDGTNVKTVLNNLSKEVGSLVEIENFVRLEVGEGIGRPEANESEPLAQAA